MLQQRPFTDSDRVTHPFEGPAEVTTLTVDTPQGPAEAEIILTSRFLLLEVRNGAALTIFIRTPPEALSLRDGMPLAELQAAL